MRLSLGRPQPTELLEGNGQFLLLHTSSNGPDTLAGPPATDPPAVGAGESAGLKGAPQGITGPQSL